MIDLDLERAVLRNLLGPSAEHWSGQVVWCRLTGDKFSFVITAGKVTVRNNGLYLGHMKSGGDNGIGWVIRSSPESPFPWPPGSFADILAIIKAPVWRRDNGFPPLADGGSSDG